MSTPKISFIVVYNISLNLEECLKSLKEQTFSNIEIICVNNGSEDDSQKIVQKMAADDTRFKLISLPIENDIEYARRIGLGVSDSNYICFIEPNNIYSVDFAKNLYLTIATKNTLKTQSDRLYKRNYLENCEEISAIIEQITKEKIKEEVQRQTTVLEAEKDNLHKEWDNFYQINGDNIKNNSYELQCRFNQLESLFYEKDKENKESYYKFVCNNNEKADELVSKIYSDIDKVYDFIKSEINLKGTEINHIYEEISSNYHYTEQLIEEKQKALYDTATQSHEPIIKKLEALEKDMVLRYVSMKRLMDTQIDELRVQLNALSGNVSGSDLSDSLGKNVSENIEKLYAHINNTSSTIYEEISNLYKELNEKIQQEKEDCTYLAEQKISELQQELNSKLECINK